MSKAESLFHEIAASIPDAKESKMFGALCIKAPNGKALAMFYKDDMVFKLPPGEMEKAMKLNGAGLFDPMGGRPMNGWVQLSMEHTTKWKDLAKKAMDYVKALEK